MADENVVEVRVGLTLMGEPAEKLLRIAAQEGNSLAAVARRLVSIGLRYETEPEDSNGR